MESLQVALASINSGQVGSSSYAPYNIGVGADEAIEIHGHMARYHVSTNSNQINIAEYALIQKTMRAGVSIPTSAIELRDGDVDILVRGVFWNMGDSPTYRNSNLKDRMMFPIPIIIPRAPTLEVRYEVNFIGYPIATELYYRIIKLSHKKMLLLMKRWKGRSIPET